MALEQGDFFSILLFVVIIVVVIVAFGFTVFALGWIAKGDVQRQPKRTREHPKENPPQPKKTKPDDPCINKDKGYHFGFLHKDLDDQTPVPEECLLCDLKLECLQGKKPK